MPPHPVQRIDRDRAIRFTFDGRSYTGLEGDTIGSALYAAG
ncbi:MAG: pyridine nucleotide-disulfide oxidoreductase, partial [Candidatus Rokuibacteriota bacterium]